LVSRRCSSFRQTPWLLPLLQDVDATTTTAYNHVTAQLPCCDHVPLIVYLLRRQQVAVVVYTNYYYYYYYALVHGVCSRSTAAATAAVVRVYLTRGVQWRDNTSRCVILFSSYVRIIIILLFIYNVVNKTSCTRTSRSILRKFNFNLKKILLTVLFPTGRKLRREKVVIVSLRFSRLRYFKYIV